MGGWQAHAIAGTLALDAVIARRRGFQGSLPSAARQRNGGRPSRLPPFSLVRAAVAGAGAKPVTIAVVIPGEQSYTKWSWSINGQEVPYGQFLGEMVNFLLLALLLFLFVVKFLGWIVREKQAETPKLSRQEELLTEIRDLLRRTAPSAPTPTPPTPPTSPG